MAGRARPADGTVRVYRTVDPFHAVWATSLPAAADAGATLAILDAGVVVLIREIAGRADQPVVTLVRSSGTQTWTVAELGGALVTTPVPERRDSCSSAQPKFEWLERAWIDGDWLVVDTLTGPPRRLSVAR